MRQIHLLPCLVLVFMLAVPAQATDITWTGGGDGTSWTDPNNWNPAQVPGDSDHAIVDLSGTYTVVLTTTTTVAQLSFGAASGTQTLHLNGRILTMSSGTIGANALVLHNNGTVAATSLLVVEGAYTWEGGFIDGNVRIDGSLLITTGSNKSLRANLTNTGTLRWEDGHVYVYLDQTLLNTGLFDVALEASRSLIRFGGTGPWTFRNEGTLRKTGEFALNVSTHFESSSLVDVQGGIVQFDYDTRWEDADIAVADGAALKLAGGTHTIVGTLSGNPVGTFSYSGNVLQSDESGSTLDIGGTGLQWEGQFVDGETPMVNTGLLRITTGSNKSLRGNLTNTGTLRWEDGHVYVYLDQTLLNTGLFDVALEANRSLIRFGGTGPWTFRNSGTLRKTGEFTLNINTHFENSSSVDVQGGTVQFDYDTRWEGADIAVAASAALKLAAGTHTIVGTLSGNPVGTFAYSGNVLQSDESGSILDIGGTGLQWEGQFVDGETPMVNIGLLRITTGSNKSLRGNLTNTGTLRWEDGHVYVYLDQTLLNTGLFDVALEASRSLIRFGGTGPWTFRNEGTLLKTGEFTLNINTSLENSSLVNVQEGVVQFDYDSRWEDASIVVADGAALKLAGGTHTIIGVLSGNPVGTFAYSGNVLQSDESGSTLDIGGTGLQWEGQFVDGETPMVNIGLLRITTGSNKSLRGNLTNDGTLRWEGGHTYIYEDQTLRNQGVFEIDLEDNRSLIRFGGDGPWTFENVASIVKTGDFQATISTITINDGSVAIEGGALQIDYNSRWENGSTIDVSTDASMILNAGVHTISGSLSGSNNGILAFQGNSVIAENSAMLNFDGNGLEWRANYLTMGELVNVGLMGLTGTSGSRGVRGSTSEFRNEGSLTWPDDGAFFVYDNGLFTNAGVLDVTGAGAIRGWATPGLFANAPTGILTKTGQGRFTIGTDIDRNRTYPRLNVKLEGALDLDGQISTRGASIANSATLNIGGNSASTLIWEGDFSAEEEAELVVTLAGTTAGTEYDHLIIEGRINSNKSSSAQSAIDDGMAVLNGKLTLSFENDYVPQAGDAFTFVSASKIVGGFLDTSDLTNETLNLSFYPTVDDTSYTLVTVEGIPTISGQLTVDPTQVSNGQLAAVAISGTGFAPDLIVSLSCVECSDPEGAGSLSGQLLSLTPTALDVTFDIREGDWFGTYSLIVSDPRTGQAQVAFTIVDGPPVLHVEVVDAVASELNNDPGRFLVRTSRPLRTPLSLPFTLSGTAKLYSDYLTDVLGGVLDMPAGQDTFSVSIFPLNDDVVESDESVTIQMQYSGPVDGALYATVQISDGPPDDAFRVFGSSPRSGGNVGAVTVTVAGQGFAEGATIRLEGGETIEAAGTVIDSTRTLLTATFLMRGEPVGLRDVVVSSGNNTEVLSGAFNVVRAVYPDVFVQVLAPPRVPRTRQRTYTVVVRNRGNVDVRGYASLSGLPPDTEWSIDEDSYKIINGNGLTWRDIAPVYRDEDSYIFALPEMTLKAGQTKQINVYTAVATPQTLRLVAAWNYNR